MELEHSYIETNGIKLHVVQAGLKSGVHARADRIAENIAFASG